MQISTFYDQLRRYFEINTDIYVGHDSFIYYREGDIRKSVVPDVYVVFGVAKMPPRRSFYTWAEGAVPAAVFEFLSDSTANQGRHEKVRQYLIDMGVEEYFLHQPDPERPSEFRGWRGSPSSGMVEIAPDGEGGLFSESLNLWLRWEDPLGHVRLLRPYLPDGTPIPTSVEEKHLREAAEAMAAEESERRREAEAELERLRAQLANRQDEGA